MTRTRPAAHEQHDIPNTLSQLTGAEVKALAIVCTVGDGEHETVTAYITPNAAVSPGFRHAIEMEGAYSDTLLSFDDSQPPYYGSIARPVNLELAAYRLGVDRVLCLVTVDAAGNIAATRDYDGLEVTLLEAAKLQFGRFTDILDEVVSHTPRMVQ